MSEPTLRIAPSVKLGKNVRLIAFANLYGCEIGDETFIGPFVEIQSDVKVGRRVKIQSHTFVCSGVTIEDEAFIGHGVMFTNDRFPRATNADGTMQVEITGSQGSGVLRSMFGVCANAWSPSDGTVVSLDHGCGAHSEVDMVLPDPEKVPSPIVDDLALEQL